MLKKDSKSIQSGRIGRLDIFVIIAIFMFTFLMRVTFFEYPVIQDSSVYAELGESIQREFKYELEGAPTHQYPPGLPFLVSLVLFFYDDAGWAVRFVSICFSSLVICTSYLFLRLLSLDRYVSLVLSGMVFFNPWFFYFTTVLGLSEGPGAFFLLLGFFFMFLYKTKKLGLAGLVTSALFFGISVMVRVVFVVVVAVFCFYFLWLFLHRKRMKDALLFMVISSLPFALWFLRGIFVKTSGGYGEYISKSILSYPYGIVYFTLLVFPFAFLGSVWFVVKSFNTVFRGDWKYWKLVLVSFVLTILVSILGWDLVNHIGMIQNPWSFSKFHIDLAILFVNPLFATRYFVPFMPVLTILFGGLFFNPKNITKKMRLILGVYVLLLFVLAGIYNYGSIQNSVADVLPMPQTSTQKLDAAVQIFDVLEQHDTGNTYVDIDVSDPVLNDSVRNLADRLCAGCSAFSQDDSGQIKEHILIKDAPCQDAELVEEEGCKDALCIFKPRGNVVVAVFQCSADG